MHTLPRRAFGQNPLQGPAVHVQPAGGLGYIMIAQFVDALDVFPADAVSRHWILRGRGFGVGAGEEGFDDVFDIGRL